MPNSEVAKNLLKNLGSGEKKVKLGNVQIVEHLEAKGVELQFHYIIRSKNDSQNR